MDKPFSVRQKTIPRGIRLLNTLPAPLAGLTSTVAVLCVDPIADDRAALQKIFDSSPWSIGPGSLWRIQTCESLKSAWRALHTDCFPLVLCESDLRPGTWRELLALLELLPEPPFLIVTSRAADEYLWAEALNLGAYDVLAKPFDRVEVMRAVSMACMRWSAQRATPKEATRALAGGAR